MAAQQQEVFFEVDGQKVHGTLVTPEQINEKHPALLFLHGWMSNNRNNVRYAEQLAELGIVTLAIDFRSHGESEGSRKALSRKQYLNDAIGGYDYLDQQSFIDSERIGVVGSSFGGYNAILLSAERAMRWLVLRAPANYPDDGFTTSHSFTVGKVREWRRKPLGFDATKSLQSLHDFNGEVLLVQSELDDICPEQTITNYKNAFTHESAFSLEIIPGADHSLSKPKHKEIFISLLMKWFSVRV